METKTRNKIKFIVPRIPDELVYELIDGKPVYYKGYKEVINLEKQIEDIMGSSDLQIVLIDLILKYLYKNIDAGAFNIFTNEAGLHIDNKNNISADIAIFERAKFFSKKLQVKYTTVAPKVIIEIDTKADLGNFDNIMEYYQVKTKKIFNFGVEKVFWILTKNKQVIEAVPNDNWLVKEWDKELQILDNIAFSIDQLLKDDGIYEWVYNAPS